MSKYIKLEDAEKLLTNALRIAQGFDEPLEKSLVDLPTIDIVECKDCVKHKTHKCHMAFDLIATEDNDFCSYGERSEDERSRR